MTKLKKLHFRVDMNLLEMGKNPGKLKNIFNNPSLSNVENVTLNLG